MNIDPVNTAKLKINTISSKKKLRNGLLCILALAIF
jgi:hypothetical protein